MPSTELLVILAIIPAVILIVFIYIKDKSEKEPLGLLIGLFFLGAATTIGAALVEVALEKMLAEATPQGTVGYNFVMCFFIVALAEEGFKFLVLRTRTWKHRAFDYTFDAIVYAVVISLGFATLENIMYITDIGTYQVAVMRGLLAVPGHAINAVFMGLFFGKAKYCQCCGDYNGKNKYIFLSMFIPILTHGFYDFCLFSESVIDGIITVFFIYEAIITITAIVVIHKASKADTALPGTGMSLYTFQNYQYGYYSQPQYQQQFVQNPQTYYTPNGYSQVNAPYQTYQQDPYQSYQQGSYQNYQQPQYQYQYYQQQYQQPQYQSYQPNDAYTQQWQNYNANGYPQQGQYYEQNGYPQQGQYYEQNYNNYPNGQ